MEKKVCECCGAYLVDQKTKWVCEHCLTEYKKSFIENDEVQRLLNDANHTRMQNKFIDAKNEYTDIINKYPDSVDAYWGRLLSELGIEYVKGDNDVYYPSCHRVTFSNIFDESDYKKVMELCDEESAEWYQEKAGQIENIRLELNKLTKNFDPFDIFISYKENDEQGNVTKDSQYVTDLYHSLTKMGYRVFLSRITLGAIAGEKYEPFIYSAITTSQVMITFSSKKGYLEATWVKNEWSRYLELIQRGQKKKGSLLPIYFGMDPYDFPIEFQGIQGFDFADIDILRKIEIAIAKIVSKKGNKFIETKHFKRREIKDIDTSIVNESIIPTLTKRILGDKNAVKELSLNEEKMLDNGFDFLHKKLFDAALVQFNNIISRNDTNYKAHFGRFLSKLHINEHYLNSMNHTDYTPVVPSDLEFSDIEYALDYAPTKQIATKLLDQSVLIFSYMQYWSVPTSYKYKVISDFFKLLISYLDENKSEELKNVLWDDFKFINEDDPYYTDNLLLVHRATILLTAEQSPDIYIKETNNLVEMLIEKGEFKKARELNDHLLKIDQHQSKLLFNQARITMKAKSDVDLLEAVIWERKIKALETLITRAKNPKESVIRILNAAKKIDVMYYVKHYRKVYKIIDMAISYLPNFNEQLFIDELLFFGEAHLELHKFKESKKYFDEILEINELNVKALWGIVKGKSKCPRDIDVIDKEVNLIKIPEYNTLISTVEDTSYYTDIYYHIKQHALADDRILEISQKTVGFEQRLLHYKKKTE
jgi:tetratricopeptide (TPR) repeat protein